MKPLRWPLRHADELVLTLGVEPNRRVICPSALYKGARPPRAYASKLVEALGFEPRVRKRDGVTARRPFLQDVASMNWCGRWDLNP